MGFSLTTHLTQNITHVPNTFIDTYMPQANGSFVKVYLYLLRQMTDVSPTLTIESMADMLSNTEADILRALRYWEKQGILSIRESDGQISEISFLPLENNAVAFSAPTEEMSAVALSAATEEIVSEPEPEKKPDIPERRTYSPLQAEALKKDSEIESCLSMVEALLGTTLGDAHMQLSLYLMSDLGLHFMALLYQEAKANPVILKPLR